MGNWLRGGSKSNEVNQIRQVLWKRRVEIYVHLVCASGERRTAFATREAFVEQCEANPYRNQLMETPPVVEYLIQRMGPTGTKETTGRLSALVRDIAKKSIPSIISEHKGAWDTLFVIVDDDRSKFDKFLAETTEQVQLAKAGFVISLHLRSEESDGQEHLEKDSLLDIDGFASIADLEQRPKALELAVRQRLERIFLEKDEKLTTFQDESGTRDKERINQQD